MSLKGVIKQKQSKNKHFVWNNIEIIIKDEVENPNISTAAVLNQIDGKIPNHLLTNVDVIYVGDFKFLNDRNIQAMYQDSSIFVTNVQDSIEDMCDDIVHEIAHSVEEIYKNIIYSDGLLEKEFINKRKQLYTILSEEGIEADLQDFLDPLFRDNFDSFLYREVGYPLLNVLSSSIFYSPYAATSLKEYFANGFEAYFYFRDYSFIKKSCPELFEKLNNLLEVKDD